MITQPKNKFNITKSIIDDAPYGDINYCTISFLTPQKMEKLKYLDVMGFKVHNGYNDDRSANDDAKNIETTIARHDIFVARLGRLHAWDDVTKTDSVEYKDPKQNELEKTRRENIDKIKLMNKQMNNEYQNIHANTTNERMAAQRKRTQKKLYKKGLITKEEYELVKQTDRPVKEIKEMAASLEKIRVEMEACQDTDYLDENPEIALKYGCLTVYSPKHIGGLKTLCFKIRGLFEIEEDREKRIKQLEQLYPNDRIYKFEVGKWCPYSEKDGVRQEDLLKQLNYAMKCHIDNMDNEKTEFEKRRDQMSNKVKTDAKATKRMNKKERKRAAKELESKSKSSTNSSTSDASDRNVPISIGDPSDDDAIRKIMDYLDDPETADKYTVDKSSLQTVEVGI